MALNETFSSVNWGNGTRRLLIFAALVIAALVLFLTLPADLISNDTVVTLAAATLLFSLLALAAMHVTAKGKISRELALVLVLPIWWFLLVSEEIFSHLGDSISAYEGHFSLQAYGEALAWALCFLALLLVCSRSPHLLAGLFRGSAKWPSTFLLICLFSASYSANHLYSLAWAFKLMVVILLLRFCSNAMQCEGDVRAFYMTTLLSFVLLIVIPVARAFSNPATAFDGPGGRLNADPSALSATASYVMLFSQMLNAMTSRKYLILTGLLGAGVMLLALGKTGIVAGLLSAVMFTIFQRRRGAGLLWLGGIAILGGLLFISPAVSGYVRNYEGLDTFTGRTNIWLSTLPGIAEKPILGRGYVSSKFLGAQTSEGFKEAEHMHNGFLDTLYNTGMLGLIPILAIHFVTIRNLFRVLGWSLRRKAAIPIFMRTHARPEIATLALGTLAIYISLLINGFFNATFGGRATSPFILLLTVLFVSDTLDRLSRSQEARAAA